MEGLLGAFTPHVLALLVGGLGASLGLTYATRTPRAQKALLVLSGRTLALCGLATVALGAALAYRLVPGILGTLLVEPRTASVLQFFVLGAAVGLPLGIPGAIAAWSDARRRDRALRKRKEQPPTKDDRRRYAADIVTQITEMSTTPRTLTADIGGDGGTVLLFEGDIDATEGERLTAALRQDLADLGFKRVEGRKGSREWWSRV
ncbi:MAG: hypothetical protein O2958_04795 [Gemmatimonadetes bacterium]|nr:hypothetical protein [Gemmatimonadota bacterium]MDA1102912.1 hypothetical protein [Gemmatimonadota bacterium]